MPLNICVVGASAAGLKAAARARRLLPDAEIVVLDERTAISFGACGLPYFLSGDVESASHLRETSYGVLRDPDFFASAKGLDVRCGLRVVSLDIEGRSVETELVDGGARESFAWDRLVIATGASPRPLVGVELGEAVEFFHTPEQAAGLRRGLETGGIGSAIVVGAGFIGCEVAGAFAELWGCETTVIEAAPYVLPQALDEDQATFVAAEMRRNGIDLHCGLPVTSVRTEDGGAVVEADGRVFKADRAIVATGVVPRVDWAAAAGLAVGERGGLVVDEQLHTSCDDIFAAGDCVEVRNLLTGDAMLMPQGSLANRQGRVVGDNLAGHEAVFGGVVGSACVKIFDWNVAVTGMTAFAAAKAGLECREAWMTADDRAHFYPDAARLFLKLVYEADTERLLGLQVTGPGEGVKRADVFAELLRRGGRLQDLLDLEYCYSPPYNAALDPLFSLGCVAQNEHRDGVVALGPLGDTGGRQVIDVRLADEIAPEVPMLEGALHLPLGELRTRLDEIPRGVPLLFSCAYGTRSAEAVRYLAGVEGYDDLMYLAGGASMQAARREG